MIGEVVNIGGDAFILAVTGVLLLCRGKYRGDGREELNFLWRTCRHFDVISADHIQAAFRRNTETSLATALNTAADLRLPYALPVF